MGSGPEVKDGDTVHVQYTGTLTSGKKFDSSYDHGGNPFKVTVGQGEVIKGWDEGLLGMRVGGKRRLRIPSNLGYGAAGSPPDIPPNAGLVFENRTGLHRLSTTSRAPGNRVGRGRPQGRGAGAT